MRRLPWSGKHEYVTEMRRPSLGMENMITTPLLGGRLGRGCPRGTSKQTGPCRCCGPGGHENHVGYVVPYSPFPLRLSIVSAASFPSPAPARGGLIMRV